MSWLAIVRSLHLAASALLAGTIAFELLVLRRSDRAGQGPDIARQLRRWFGTLNAMGLVVALVSWVVWLAGVTIGMTGLPMAEALSPHNLAVVVSRTTFGHVWALRCALFVLVALLLVPWRMAQGPARRIAALRAAVITVLLGSLAWAGHAVASHPAHVWVDAAHLCAAAVWLGMLPPLVLVVHRAASGGDAAWQRLAAVAARSFSAPGMVAVLVLAITGILNSWWLVGTPAGLFDTAYGLLLAGKLLLFAGMLGLAASNRMVLVPRGALRQLRRNIVAEIVLGAAVLGVVGSLGVTPPATHEQAIHHHEHEHQHPQ